MEDTGGTVEDYVRLNADYSNVDEKALLKEYYKKNKPHLDSDDINLILEDYEWDEDVHEEKEIRKKKLAFKEEVAKARTYLDNLKDKYYDEIKLRPGVNQEQQKAMDFFNRYNKESAEQQKITQSQREVFDNKTKSFFNDQFKGFEYKVGEKRYRFNVKNVNEVKNTQSDINNFVKRFLNEKNEMNDAAGYHKSLFTAMNADAIANHFYEQGKADAVKDMMAKSKNVSNEPRTTSTGDVYINGLRVKAISGVDSSKLKVRINKK